MEHQQHDKPIQAAELAVMIRRISDLMAANKEELCQMDAQMGDGDLGITMSRGWLAAAEMALSCGETDLGKMLVKSGMKMASAAPSTMGTLMAAGLMEAGRSLAGQTALDAKVLADFFDGFCKGIIKRGRCSPGDRTVLDSIWPAARMAELMLDDDSLADSVEKIRDAARSGMESTRGMEPKFGRAAVLAARTKGLVDQGAFAGFLMIDAICTYLQEDRSTSH